jgi:hypothetical protein
VEAQETQRGKLNQFGQKLVVQGVAVEVFIQLHIWQEPLELLDKEMLEAMEYKLVLMQAAQEAEVRDQ